MNTPSTSIKTPDTVRRSSRRDRALTIGVSLALGSLFVGGCTNAMLYSLHEAQDANAALEDQAANELGHDGFQNVGDIDFDGGTATIYGLHVGKHCVLSEVTANVTYDKTGYIADLDGYTVVLKERYIDPLHLGKEPVQQAVAENAVDLGRAVPNCL